MIVTTVVELCSSRHGWGGSEIVLNIREIFSQCSPATLTCDCARCDLGVEPVVTPSWELQYSCTSLTSSTHWWPLNQPITSQDSQPSANHSSVLWGISQSETQFLGNIFANFWWLFSCCCGSKQGSKITKLYSRKFLEQRKLCLQNKGKMKTCNSFANLHNFQNSPFWVT